MRMAEEKHARAEAPSTNIQAPEKFQAPSSKLAGGRTRWGILLQFLGRAPFWAF
jgi:hypothetical protein